MQSPALLFNLFELGSSFEEFNWRARIRLTDPESFDEQTEFLRSHPESTLSIAKNEIIAILEDLAQEECALGVKPATLRATLVRCWSALESTWTYQQKTIAERFTHSSPVQKWPAEPPVVLTQVPPALDELLLEMDQLRQHLPPAKAAWLTLGRLVVGTLLGDHFADQAVASGTMSDDYYLSRVRNREIKAALHELELPNGASGRPWFDISHARWRHSNADELYYSWVVSRTRRLQQQLRRLADPSIIRSQPQPVRNSNPAALYLEEEVAASVKSVRPKSKQESSSLASRQLVDSDVVSVAEFNIAGELDEQRQYPASIDLSQEQLLPISAAIGLIPGGIDMSTLHRWRKRGIRGIQLETLRIGGRRYTSVEALQRFADATTTAQGSVVPRFNTTKSLRARHLRAEKELAAEGI